MSSSAANVITIGRQLGLMLFKFIEAGKVTADKIHMIGHSLGAHVAHYASIWLQTLAQQNGLQGLPGRITGLDPMGVLLENINGTYLTNNDAEFVDVIHTSTPTHVPGEVPDEIRGRIGMYHELGDVDFFPYGGTTPQPGCDSDVLFSLIQAFMDFSSVERNFLCSHYKAVDYFIRSLQTEDGGPEPYPSEPCVTMIEAAGEVPPKKKVDADDKDEDEDEEESRIFFRSRATKDKDEEEEEEEEEGDGGGDGEGGGEGDGDGDGDGDGEGEQDEEDEKKDDEKKENEGENEDGEHPIIPHQATDVEPSSVAEESHPEGKDDTEHIHTHAEDPSAMGIRAHKYEGRGRQCVKVIPEEV